MKLFFLRHGIAEDAHGGMLDGDRALTEEGRTKLQHVGQACLRLEIKPNIVLTSPLVRAAQTADIVAPIVGSPIEIAQELQPGCLLDDLQRLLRRYPYDSIMLVGHEPDFSAMAARLINADERGIALKKGGIIRVDIDGRPQPGRGILAALLTPRTLSLIAEQATQH